jgi:hypothetical protein
MLCSKKNDFTIKIQCQTSIFFLGSPCFAWASQHFKGGGVPPPCITFIPELAILELATPELAILELAIPQLVLQIPIAMVLQIPIALVLQIPIALLLQIPIGSSNTNW